jgi:hypothetical protein
VGAFIGPPGVGAENSFAPYPPNSGEPALYAPGVRAVVDEDEGSSRPQDSRVLGRPGVFEPASQALRSESAM